MLSRAERSSDQPKLVSISLPIWECLELCLGHIIRENSTSSEDLLEDVIFLVCIMLINYVISVKLISHE